MVRQSKKNGKAKLSKTTAHRIQTQLASSGGANPYEAMLIQMDAPAIGIPDEYPHETSKITLKTVVDLPWASGATSAVIGHSLDRFVEVTGGPSTIDTSYKFFANTCASGATLIGPDGDHFGVIDATFTTCTMWATAGFGDSSILSTKPALFDQSGNPVPTDRGKVYVNPGDTVTVTTTSSDTTANAWKARCYVLVSGSWQWVDSPTVTGTGAYIGGTVTLPAGTSALTEVSVTRVSGTGGLLCPGISTASPNWWTVTRTSGTSVVAYPIGDAVGTNLQTIQTSAGRYRIAANKVWVQYRGNALANGTITCGQLPTTDLHYLPDMSLDSIALIPDVYNGPLNKGAYMWKRPLDSSDFAFEDVINPDDDTGSVFVLFASAQSADAEHLTLVIETNIELQTANQVFARSTNLIDPPMIWAAQANLKAFPSAMENPTHFATIARKLYGDAKRASLAIAETARKWAPLAEMALAMLA